MDLICLEGCSGVGKTTQFRLLIEYFKNTKIRTLGIVEKHYEPFKREVEAWYQTKGPKLPFSIEDIEGFAKARAQTFKDNFRKSNYDLLIFDRYYYTSAAYQTSCGLRSQEILNINKKYGAPTPNLTFLLDCNTIESFSRSQSRNAITGIGSLFSTNIRNVEKIRDNYYELLKQNCEMELIITNRDIPKIQKDLVEKIMQVL
ncbi:MAG: AAA family ATPase [Candidatus Nanoarchaeia archaeon]|nr:AAA family ATPase [Candidatus Nanoarchaeia archaeon]